MIANSLFDMDQFYHFDVPAQAFPVYGLPERHRSSVTVRCRLHPSFSATVFLCLNAVPSPSERVGYSQESRVEVISPMFHDSRVFSRIHHPGASRCDRVSLGSLLRMRFPYLADPQACCAGPGRIRASIGSELPPLADNSCSLRMPSVGADTTVDESCYGGNLRAT